MRIPFLLSLLAATTLFATDLPPQRTPDEVLLVINSGSPISQEIGADYSTQRHVKNILTVECQDSAAKTENETISYDNYVKLVEKPVRDYLASHHGIDFIVLTKGIPLRVKGGTTGNAAGPGTPIPSLDSSLAALDYESQPNAKKYHFTSKEQYGANGYAYANRYYNAKEPFSHQKFGGYLVTRLDAYTKETAIALTTWSLEADTKRPTGPVLLDVQPEFGLGDPHTQPTRLPSMTVTAESPWSEFNADMAHAASVLKSRNIPVELDTAKEFVGNRDNLAGYYSWGSNDAHFKADAYQSLHFAPGSISDTAVSTCARTFLPTEGGQTLTADLIAHGLTAAKGYCDEPWLQANSSPTIVLDRYTSGYTMAESFYAGSKFLGWEDIVIGDPLCAPYRNN